MIDKTKLGVGFFDSTYGGIYRGRPILISGRTGTGKTIAGIQFVHQGLSLDERCLMLSTLSAFDLAICAEGVGLSLSAAVDAGNMILLEYERLVIDRSADRMLPPDSFDQLRELIDANGVRRVVLDTVLPWVAVRQPGHLAERVFSFVRALDRLGVTSLLTLPKPVSPEAFRLRNALETVVPVSVMLTPGADESHFHWMVNKCLGEKRSPQTFTYRIVENGGLVGADDANARFADTPEASSGSGDGRGPGPEAGSDRRMPEAERRPRFAKLFPLAADAAAVRSPSAVHAGPSPDELAASGPGGDSKSTRTGRSAGFSSLWPEGGKVPDRET